MKIYIFQFEQLTYDEKNQTKEGVELILKPCNYTQGKVTYYDSKGNKKTLNKTYVDVIMEASKEYNISPYHLASRIRQEQGAGMPGSMISLELGQAVMETTKVYTISLIFVLMEKTLYKTV